MPVQEKMAEGPARRRAGKGRGAPSAPCATVAEASGDGLVTLARFGRPPLRLRARPGPCIEASTPDGAPIRARLFWRPDGSAALCFPRVSAAGTAEDALHGPDLAALFAGARAALSEDWMQGGSARPGRGRTTARDAARRLGDRWLRAETGARVLRMLAALEEAVIAGGPGRPAGVTRSKET